MNRHKISIEIQVENHKDLDNSLRFILGLQGILHPMVQLSWSVERSEDLDKAEDLDSREYPDVPF